MQQELLDLWQYHADDSTLWDVHLVALDDDADDGGRAVHAQRAQLAASSGFFRRLFMGRFLDSNERRLPVREVRYDVLREAVRFLYSGCDSLQLDDGSAHEFIELGDRLQMPAVLAQACAYLERRLSPIGAVATYVLSRRHSCMGLSASARAYVAAHPASVAAETPEEVLRSLPPDQLMELPLPAAPSAANRWAASPESTACSSPSAEAAVAAEGAVAAAALEGVSSETGCKDSTASAAAEAGDRAGGGEAADDPTSASHSSNNCNCNGSAGGSRPGRGDSGPKRGVELLEWVAALRGRGIDLPLGRLPQLLQLGRCSARELAALSQHPLSEEVPELLRESVRLLYSMALRYEEVRYMSEYTYTEEDGCRQAACWRIANWASKPAEIRSPEFRIGDCDGWRLWCYPRGNSSSDGRHVSMYLYCPEGFSGTVQYQFFMGHPSDPSRTFVTCPETNTYTPQVDNWGFPSFFALSELGHGSGFVEGGALTVGVNAKVCAGGLRRGGRRRSARRR